MNITKPTIIIDEKKVRQNIEKMSRKAQKGGCRLRPHCKSLQSADIASILKEYGITSITVSSVDMAAYFASHGWKDITVAVPLNIRQIDEINRLAGKISLGVVVESVSSARFLAGNSRSPLNVWIEIDSGENRTGVHWKNTAETETIAEIIREAKTLSLSGLLTHAGQSYEQASVTSIQKVHQDSITRMNTVRDHMSLRGFTGLKISTGDTPTCSIMNDFSRVDEIRPGNFVIYDLIQVSLGACTEEDIAVTLACPVISKHPERNELVIYGGGAHFAKDFLLRDGTPYFGLVTLPTKTGWSASIKNAWLDKLSQVHGTVKAEKDFIEKINIGDILTILPIHSCLTTNLHQTFLTVEGKTLTSFHYELTGTS